MEFTPVGAFVEVTCMEAFVQAFVDDFTEVTSMGAFVEVSSMDAFVEASEEAPVKFYSVEASTTSMGAFAKASVEA